MAAATSAARIRPLIGSVQIPRLARIPTVYAPAPKKAA